MKMPVGTEEVETHAHRMDQIVILKIILRRLASMHYYRVLLMEIE